MARAKSKAKDDGEMTDEEQLAANLGNLELHESGVALDPDDPNYEQQKRIEDMRVELARARYEATESGQARDAEVTKLKLDTEEANVRAQLKAAQESALAAKGNTGADGLLESVQAQRDAAQAAADAASSEGK